MPNGPNERPRQDQRWYRGERPRVDRRVRPRACATVLARPDAGGAGARVRTCTDTDATPPRAPAPAPIVSSQEPVTLGLLAPLTLAAGLALAAVALADGASRSGQTWGPLVYWTALGVCAALFAFRLGGSRASRVERVGLVVVFGFFLYGVKILRDPTGFTYADELVHAYNVDSIVSTHSLFAPNAILAVTPHYPGLETATAALRLVGVQSTFVSGLIIVALARLLMMVTLFLLFERVSGSSSRRGARIAPLHGEPGLRLLHRRVLLRAARAATRDSRRLLDHPLDEPEGGRPRGSAGVTRPTAEARVGRRRGRDHHGRRGDAPHHLVCARDLHPGDRTCPARDPPSLEDVRNAVPVRRIHHPRNAGVAPVRGAVDLELSEPGRHECGQGRDQHVHGPPGRTATLLE